MKPLIVASLAFLILTAFNREGDLSKPAALTCTLKSDKKVYKVGELPELKVEIVNNTTRDIYLIGSLDGSDVRWRMPYCYFTIQKPTLDTVQLARCGVVNPLRTEDFALVKAGQKFNPYQRIDSYRFFTDPTINNSGMFKSPGIYKIQFHYSTNSSDITKYSFDRRFVKSRSDSMKLFSFFKNVPKTDIESNEIEITFEE